MNSIKLIKKVDQIIGPVLLKLFPKTSMISPDTSPLKRILVIRPGGIGDALLLLPALKEVALSFNAAIDIVCEPRNKSVFISVPFIRQIFSYRALKSMVTVLQKKYDAVFDTEQSHFLSAIITKLVRADIKVGFKTNGREKMYNKSINYSHQCYEAKMFWKLFSSLYPLNNNFYFNFPYFKLPCHHRSLPFKNQRAICLFPGATINERLWPEKRWAELMDWIADKNIKPILIGGSKEYGQCRNIMAQCRTNKGLNLCNRLSIPETVRLFIHISLLISADSGILHLGVLCNIPTISLFGPGIIDKWAPRGKQHVIISKNLPCSPCTKFGTTPPCTNKNACMMEITIHHIFEGLRKLGIS